jgi:uncharacterized repeat protein (TIGR01451 family)
MRMTRTLLLLACMAALAVGAIASTTAAESIDVNFGIAPTLDATITGTEWDDAESVNVSVGGTNGTIYFKHDGENLYLAFQYSSGQMAEVYVDKDHDEGTAPGTDDLCLHASTALMERFGTGTAWTGWNTVITDWDADTGYPTVREFSIPFSYLDITAGTPKTLGLLLYMFTTSEGGYWPSGADVDDPSTWGDMASSDDWEGAPNIVPELSQPVFYPASGDTSTDFRFQVRYRDINGEIPTIARVIIGTNTHDMTTDSNGPWNMWNLYYYDTRLPPGSDHLFHFVFSDGRDSVRLPAITDNPNRITGPVVAPPNRAPELDGAWLSMDNGTRMDTFEFTINYTDHDNDAAAVFLIYLDEVRMNMTGDSTEWSKGVTFRFSTQLDLGTHQYYFLFSDGKKEVRFPDTNAFEGPVVYNLDPVAVLTFPEVGTRFAPDEYVAFSSAGTADPEGDDLAYSWVSDLDGLLSNQPAFDKLLSEGDHQIWLNVTDEYGGTDSVQVVILVKAYLPLPVLDRWSASIEAPIEGDRLEYTVTVGNSGEADALGVEVRFLLDGFEMATDTISIDEGDTVNVKFAWDVEPGDFTVRFETDWDFIEFTQHVEPNTPPDLTDYEFEGTIGDPPELRVGHQVTITIEVEDAEGDEISTEWDLDDGTEMNDVLTVTHTYDEPGQYAVMITLIDARGGAITYTIELAVVPNNPPVVNVEEIPVTVIGDTVTFNATATDPDGDALTYHWDFGDGDTSTWLVPEHIYAEPGTYNVTLTVTDSEGEETVRTVQVVVEKPKKTNGDDESPGFGAVLVLLAMVGLLVIATGRR